MPSSTRVHLRDEPEGKSGKRSSPSHADCQDGVGAAQRFSQGANPSRPGCKCSFAKREEQGFYNTK